MDSPFCTVFGAGTRILSLTSTLAYIEERFFDCVRRPFAENANGKAKVGALRSE
jgi:hypothetical protein